MKTKHQPITVHLPIHAAAAEIVNRVAAWQRDMQEHGLEVHVTPSLAAVLEMHLANGADYFSGVHLNVEIVASTPDQRQDVLDGQ